MSRMPSARPSTGSKLTPWSLLVFVGAWVFTTPAAAENFFVRPEDSTGGTNSGADWDHAWRGFASIVWGAGPGALGPGDVCWIAGGIYRQPLVVRGNGAPERLLLLRRARATDSDAAGAAGWRDSFDTAVVIRAAGTCILFPDGNGSHLVLDGQTPSGIRVDYENGGTGVEIDGQTTVTNLTLRFIEASGPGPVLQVGDTRGFDLTPVAWLADVTLSHCSAHHSDTLLQVGPSVDLIVEHCDFHHARTLNPEFFHPNAIYLATAIRPTLRFNFIHDFDVEGVFFGDPGNVGALIYGNVFYQGASAPDSGRGLEFDQNADSVDFRVHHNTFVSLPLPGINFASGRAHPGASARNNLFADCVAEFGTVDHDYNFYTSRAPAEAHGVTGPTQIFVDAARFNYRLAGHLGPDRPRDRGQALGAPFDRDADDRERGVDGAWDIGAYEFASSTAPSEPATPLPSPPVPSTPNAPSVTPGVASPPAHGGGTSIPALAVFAAALAVRAYIGGATNAQRRRRN